jgi:hypothetical protein
MTKLTTGVMEEPIRTILLLYNDQPKIFDLPEEDAVKFAALETLCTWFPFPDFLHPHLSFLSISITCFLLFLHVLLFHFLQVIFL